MDLTNKLERIEINIKNGLKFRAADRLRNMINQYPNESILWTRLAELYYESGFLASAGKYWILTEPKDEKIKKCVEIYEKSVNYSGTKILQDITFRGEKSKLTEYGQKKLTELELDSKKRTNYVPKYSPILNKKNKKELNQKKSFKEQLIKFGFFTILILILIFIIVGFINVINWIF